MRVSESWVCLQGPLMGWRPGGTEIPETSARNLREGWAGVFHAVCSDPVVGALKVLGKGLNGQFTRITFGLGTHIEIIVILP